MAPGVNGEFKGKMSAEIEAVCKRLDDLKDWMKDLHKELRMHVSNCQNTHLRLEGRLGRMVSQETLTNEIAKSNRNWREWLIRFAFGIGAAVFVYWINHG